MNVKGATGRLSIENCTVADNRTRLAGGGVAATEGGTATNANTILWGNAPDQVSSGVASHHSCVEGGASGAGNLTNAPSMTPVLCRLLAGSPCINSGTNAAWMTTATDIEADDRIAGTVVDIGADEFVDSDSDGLSDAWELRYFGDLDGADGTADGDADGLTDAEESAWDTDPADADTDGDGASDGDEVAATTSPTTSATPDTLSLAVSIGDKSDKQAEKYKIVFSNAAEVIESTGLNFGGLWSTNLVFQKGTSYTIRVEHVGTSPVTNSSDCWPEPDYDYTAEIESKPNSTNGTHEAWIYGDGFIIHDPDKILGTHDGEDCTPDFAATNGSGMATLYVLKVEIEKCPLTFEPKGGSEDNTVQIKAKVTPDTAKGKFKFTLLNVSDEPGYCLNAPKPAPLSGEDSTSWKDLQFLSGQPGFTVSGASNETAESITNDLSDATVTVKSFDYGAYGKIKVEFTTQDGTFTCTGKEEGGTKEYTNIPLDNDGNHIWDNWTYTSAGLPSGDSDKNTSGTVWGAAGDGLSRYEEWRGIFYSYSALHHRLDPTVKDVVVHNVDSIWGLSGDNAFGAVAQVNMVLVLDVYDSNRVINFNHETAHVVDQHVIRLTRADLGGEWSWGMNVGAGGTPEEGGMPDVDDAQVVYDCVYRDSDFLKHAVGHELCHGIGGKHEIGSDHYPKHSGPTDCIVRVPTQDCQDAGSSEAAWNAIPLGTTWSCASDQKVSDVY